MKLTVSEWNQFWRDLTEDWYIEDSTFPDDMPPEGIIEGEGALCWQGNGNPIDVPNELITLAEREEGHADFAKVFKRWRKKQNSRTYTVQVPSEKTAEFEKLVKSLKAQILS